MKAITQEINSAQTHTLSPELTESVKSTQVSESTFSPTSSLASRPPSIKQSSINNVLSVKQPTTSSPTTSLNLSTPPNELIFGSPTEKERFFNAPIHFAGVSLTQLHRIVDFYTAENRPPKVAFHVPKVVQLLEKPQDERTPQDLVDAGLLRPEQLKDVKLTPCQVRHLTSNAAILALARGITPDLKAFARVPNLAIEQGILSTIREELSRIKTNKGKSNTLNEIKADMVKSNLFINLHTEGNWFTPLEYVAASPQLFDEPIAEHFEGVNRIDILNDLVTCGVKDSLNWLGPSGLTALHWAARKENPEGVKTLLKAGADPYLTSDHGWTALHHATNEGDLETVKALVAAGPNAVNQQNNEGLTPLYYATSRKNIEMVKILIEAGALNSANQPKDFFESMPLELAKKMENTELLALLSTEEETAAPQEHGEQRQADKGSLSFKRFLTQAKKTLRFKK